jgi:hypothetical protein
VRLIILILSIAATFFIGYAVAGISTFLYGSGRSDLILIGLLGGISCGTLALMLWKKIIIPRSTENRKDKRNIRQP